MLTESANLPVKEAARRLGISVSKLYQLAAGRRIGHYRIGGKILFSEQDIAAFLSGCRVGVAADTPVASAPRVPLKLKHIRLS
jgi:excisionase family DNA binding protein